MEARIIYPVRVVYRKKTRNNNRYLIKGKTDKIKIRKEVKNIFDGFNTIKKYFENGTISIENFINLFLEIKDIDVPIFPKYLDSEENNDEEENFLNKSFEYFEDRLIDFKFKSLEKIPTFIKNESGNFYNLYYQSPFGKYGISNNIYCRKHAEIIYEFINDNYNYDEISLSILKKEIENLKIPYYIFSIDLN
ncbi:MAG: hypothetical protein NTX85_02370 [Candidatus Nomurabacteria bacterium]|nr:hypothetical protein [Candidatus Nomurabacteria bacterium]